MPKRHPSACVFLAQTQRSPGRMPTVDFLKCALRESELSTQRVEEAGLAAAKAARKGCSWLRAFCSAMCVCGSRQAPSCPEACPLCRAHPHLTGVTFEQGYFVIPVNKTKNASSLPPQTPARASTPEPIPSEPEKTYPMHGGISVQPAGPITLPLVDARHLFFKRVRSSPSGCRLQRPHSVTLRQHIKDLDEKEFEFRVVPSEYDDFVSESDTGSDHDHVETIGPPPCDSLRHSASDSCGPAKIVDGYLVVPPQFQR